MNSSESVVCLIALIAWLMFVAIISIMISPWCLLVLLLGLKCKKTDTKKYKKEDNEL